MNRDINKELWKLLDNGHITEDTFHKIKSLDDIDMCKFVIYTQIRLMVYKIVDSYTLRLLPFILMPYIIILIINIINSASIKIIGLMLLFIFVHVLLILSISHDIISESLKSSRNICEKVDILHKIIKEEVNLDVRDRDKHRA